MCRRLQKMFSRDSQVAHIPSNKQMKMGLKGFSWADTWALGGISTNTSSGGPKFWIKLDFLLTICVLSFNNANAVLCFKWHEWKRGENRALWVHLWGLWFLIGVALQEKGESPSPCHENSELVNKRLIRHAGMDLHHPYMWCPQDAFDSADF